MDSEGGNRCRRKNQLIGYCGLLESNLIMVAPKNIFTPVVSCAGAPAEVYIVVVESINSIVVEIRPVQL